MSPVPLPERVPENVSMANMLRLIREHNKSVAYQRSLTPLGSNTETLVHTALGVRRGSNAAPVTTNSDNVWL